MSARVENLFFWILLGIGLLLFSLTVYVAVMNRGSEYSYQVLKPILGGIGVSLLLLMTMLLSPLDGYTKAIDVLVVAKESGQIVPLEQLTMRKYGPNLYSGYQHFVDQSAKYWRNTQDPEGWKTKLSPDELSQYLLELAEWSTMTWIASAYPLHWQMERESFRAISGETFSASVKSAANPRDAMKISICGVLPENRFAKSYRSEKATPSHILIPSGSSVKFKAFSKRHHVVVIDTGHNLIEVGFVQGGGGMIHNSDLAEAVEKMFGPAWNQHIKICFRVAPKRLYRWSRNTQNQQQWRGIVKCCG